MRSNRTRLTGFARRYNSKTNTRKHALLSQGFEALEVRQLLAVDAMGTSAWTNASNRLDVNNDGMVSANDALHVIDDIKRLGLRSLVSSEAQTQPLALSRSVSDNQFVDVNGDGLVSGDDALIVINALNPAPQKSAAIELVAVPLDAPADQTLAEARANALTTIRAGEYFYIRAYVTDIRTNPSGQTFEGIFAAYADISFNGAPVVAAPADALITVHPFFNVGQNGFAGGAGEENIEEAGGISEDTTGPESQDPQLFMSVAVRATAATAPGAPAIFTPNFAEDSVHHVLFYEAEPTLTADDISFVSSAPLTITNAALPALPTISIANQTVTETDSGTVSMTFTVTVSNNNIDTRVTYRTVDNTATSSGTTRDFNPIPSSESVSPQLFQLTFSAGGPTTKTLTVTVRADDVAEGTETFYVQLSDALNGTIAGDGRGIGTILDDDGAQGRTVSINDVTITEGNTGSSPTTSVNVPITISSAPTADVVVVYTTANGSATTADGDYQTTTGAVTFTPTGPLTLNAIVQVVGDIRDENPESFVVNLTSVTTGTSIADGQASVNITDDDATPTVQITSSPTLPEGGTGTTTTFPFVVTLSAVSGRNVTVNYATANGTASGSAGSTGDYVAKTSSLTILAGDTTGVINIVVNGDATEEADETFTVTLTGQPTNATLGANVTGTATITNDDTPGPIFNISTPAAVVEGAAGTTTTQTFTVLMTQTPGNNQSRSVVYTIANGTATQADGDYTANPTSGTLVFAVGETSKTISVTVNGDNKDELNESYTVTLSSPSTGTSIGTAVATGNITDDDTSVISIGNVSLTEGTAGTTNFPFVVTLSTPNASNVTVAYTTVNGSAVSGALPAGDYIAQSGTLTILAGQTTGTINIAVNGDTTTESNETFTVVLSNPSSNASLGANSTGTGTIIADELPTFSIDTPTAVNEGGSGATTTQTFTVTLSQAPTTGQKSTVVYTIADGTATQADNDYSVAPTSGTLTFEAGQTTKTIPVTINGDSKFENNETYTVTLSNASTGTGVGTAVGTGTITNDDAKPTVSIAGVSLPEGNSGPTTFAFPVTLDAVSAVDVIVNYATANGTATSRRDYVAQTSSLTILAGQTTGVINIVVNGDLVREQNEQFTVTLSNPQNASLSSTPSATGTILDDGDTVVDFASVAGKVYIDTDNDGSQDFVDSDGDGEPESYIERGVFEMTVTLTNLDTGEVLTDETDEDGNYLFEELEPGEYTLEEGDDSGYLDGKDTVTIVGATKPNGDAGDMFRFTLEGGEEATGNNFAERGAALGSQSVRPFVSSNLLTSSSSSSSTSATSLSMRSVASSSTNSAARVAAVDSAIAADLTGNDDWSAIALATSLNQSSSQDSVDAAIASDLWA